LKANHPPEVRVTLVGQLQCESAWKIDPHLGDIGVEK
jgi:hypothetical protein